MFSEGIVLKDDGINEGLCSIRNFNDDRVTVVFLVIKLASLFALQLAEA